LFITSENVVKLCFTLYFPLLSKRPWNPYRALILMVFLMLLVRLLISIAKSVIIKTTKQITEENK
jgi:hypothetical protein